jgi:Fe-S-cluster containining protein
MSKPDETEASLPSFDDDVDTVPQCTGACCDPVVVLAEDYWDASRNPKQHKNARYVMNMLTPRQRPVPQHGVVHFSCRYFDQDTRRCIAYDRRPAMCRDYPQEGICRHCGGRFATGTRREEEGLDREKLLDHARLDAMRSLISMETASSATRPPSRKPRRRSR